MSKVENAIKWMENAANDNSHGYDQKYRWGERGDYDCSGAVITAWRQAGIDVKAHGATYTGNMYSGFLKAGFKNVTSTVNLATGAGLKRGDVLLTPYKHTAMYCGNGKEVEASINEKGKAVGGRPGDQTGREFLIRAYRNLPWRYVLRYPEAVSAPVTANKPTGTKSIDEIAAEVVAGKWGSGAARRTKLAAAGYDYNTVQAAVNARLSGKAPAPAKKSNAEIAKEVISGKWGSGATRKSKLAAAGYSYAAVQAEVNRLLRK